MIIILLVLNYTGEIHTVPSREAPECHARAGTSGLSIQRQTLSIELPRLMLWNFLQHKQISQLKIFTLSGVCFNADVCFRSTPRTPVRIGKAKIQLSTSSRLWRLEE
jgi:hypothetical protein